MQTYGRIYEERTARVEIYLNEGEIHATATFAINGTFEYDRIDDLDATMVNIHVSGDEGHYDLPRSFLKAVDASHLVVIERKVADDFAFEWFHAFPEVA